MIHAQVISDAPDLGGEGRGAEVAKWLETTEEAVESFVILDDAHRESFEAHGFTDVFVQTLLRDENNPLNEGLTEAMAAEAIRVLRA